MHPVTLFLEMIFRRGINGLSIQFFEILRRIYVNLSDHVRSGILAIFLNYLRYMHVLSRVYISSH